MHRLRFVPGFPPGSLRPAHFVRLVLLEFARCGNCTSRAGVRAEFYEIHDGNLSSGALLGTAAALVRSIFGSARQNLVKAGGGINRTAREVEPRLEGCPRLLENRTSAHVVC